MAGSRRPLFILISATLLCVALFVLVGLLAATRTAMLLSLSQWEVFFPSWFEFLDEYINSDTCIEEIDLYRKQWREFPRAGYYVIDCVLKEMPEYRKSELASSGVILGLGPAFLASVASPFADTSIMAFHCPSLAILVASGSPAIQPFKPREYAESVHGMSKSLQKIGARTGIMKWGPRRGLRQLIPEHLLAIAAVANTAHLTYGLGVYAVVNLSPSRTTLPGVYLACAIVLHLVSVLISWPHFAGCTKSGFFHTKLIEELGGYTVLCSSLLFIGSTICMLLGTVLLSSLLFLSAWDSLVVVLRYIASAAACRFILSIEVNAINAWVKRETSATAPATAPATATANP